MEAYATVPPDDPFAVSKGMLAALADELAGPAAAVLTACELEELLDERGRDVVRQLLQDHFDLRRVREERQAREHPGPVEGADGITRARLETGHGRLLATMFGTVRVTRCAWRPLDHRLAAQLPDRSQDLRQAYPCRPSPTPRSACSIRTTGSARTI